jgi:DNA-binding NarL/FixJ family response regulator
MPSISPAVKPEALKPADWNTRAIARPRLLLADDHDLLLEAFRRLLEPEFTIMRAVTDGESLVQAALSLRPDAVISDIAMPGLGGLSAVRRVHASLPAVRFIILTMHDDPELVAEALRAGASAYVLKRSSSRELLTAIRTALKGREYLCSGVARVNRSNIRRGYPEGRDPLGISPRSQEVLKLLAGGHTMKETAASLGISPRTVAFHKYRIMQQLSLRSSAELVQFAVRRRIV